MSGRWISNELDHRNPALERPDALGRILRVVYGTEGLRFESCRARLLFPVVEGD